ncbi:CpsD/CapB family tyrosine-protein kinase [Pontibacillus litoralis]|uniref:non-specific protein-tyrosine kinase n=1 Tax=Pontibacillus litoralis JSM 072002 TaxID=1385512 RepID=A0A0A5G2V2_9BACI|nr:CpsD/CapB family tyrosine-protein kinase [Pontibacillus litoralis]KGX86374.1 tyrosine protein kinase [Pontibacillus litoralis JSM 072002]
MWKKQRKPSRHQARTLITDLNPKSPIAEQFRTIRTNINFSFVDTDMETLMVTSSGPSEGKSSITANLAVVFAQQGKSVLLIDADLRKPTLHYTLRTNNTVGLSSCLVGTQTLEETVQTTAIDNLYAMTSGPIPPNPSELLGSRAMRKLIHDARAKYDVVIFDTPPVLAVTDAQILSNLCDGTILVVRHKQTDIEQAKRAKELLDKAEGKLIGTVLNDMNKQKQNYYYYYGD